MIDYDINSLVKKSLQIFDPINDLYFSGLFEGIGGVTLYLGYVKEKRLDSMSETLFENYYKKYLDVISNTNQQANFCNGLAGISWLLNVLYKRKIIDIENDLDEINRLVIKSTKADYEFNNYDLFYGYIGKVIGLSNQSNSSFNFLLEEAIRNLRLSSIKTYKGICWEDPQNKRVANLGIPHGIPGIVSFLCDYKEFQLEGKNNSEMIEKALDWLLSIEKKGFQWSFPTGLSIDTNISSNKGRLAWCYGDLAVSFALLKGSKTLNNKFYFDNGLRIAIRTLEHSLLNTGIVKISGTNLFDVGLCHGAASICLLYKKIFEISQNESIYKAYISWLDFTFKEVSKHLNDFDSIPENKEIFENIVGIKKFGLLEGITGALLLLLSSKFKDLNEWERIFLVNT